jgi:hypothetical protein
MPIIYTLKFSENQKGKPSEMDLSLIEIMISQKFRSPDIYIFIAVLTSSAYRKRQSQMTLPFKEKRDYLHV